MDTLSDTLESPLTSLDLLFQVSKEISTVLDLNTVLNRVLALSIQHVGATSGSIVLLDEQKQLLETAFSMPGYMPDKGLVDLEVTFEQGLAGWVARHEQPVIIRDTSHDQRWFQRPDDGFDQTGAKAAISVPIMARSNTIGVMTLVHVAPGFFSDEHLNLVQSIADQAGLVILNARLDLELQRQIKLEKMWTEYASVREGLIEMIYHDLRSPLTNVISSLEALSQMELQNQLADSLVKIALRSTEHIQRLTNSILDINRLEAGHKIINPSLIQASTMLDYCISTINLLSTDKHLQILVDLPEEIDNFYADEGMIRRVVINLLENAVKFSPSEGKIWVGANRQNEAILFWVKDIGPGISVSNQKKIFEKFFRLQPKESSRGLGLGLAYCRLAVQAHGGEIWVESQPGQGAVFKFTLPIAAID